jgi:hypothetical protein
MAVGSGRVGYPRILGPWVSVSGFNFCSRIFGFGYPKYSGFGADLYFNPWISNEDPKDSTVRWSVGFPLGCLACGRSRGPEVGPGSCFCQGRAGGMGRRRCMATCVVCWARLSACLRLRGSVLASVTFTAGWCHSRLEG